MITIRKVMILILLVIVTQKEIDKSINELLFIDFNHDHSFKMNKGQDYDQQ